MHDIIAITQDARKCVLVCQCGTRFQGKTEEAAEAKFQVHARG